MRSSEIAVLIFKHQFHWCLAGDGGYRWGKDEDDWDLNPNNWKMEIKTYLEGWYVRCGAGWEKGPVPSRAWEWCCPHERRSGTDLGWDFVFRLGHIWWYLGLWKPPCPAHLVGQGRGFSMDDHAHVYGKEITKVYSH